MKAKLERSISLNNFTLYAEIEVPETRNDIKDYLNNSLDKKSAIHQKVKAHLLQIGLLNASNSLTTKGQIVAKTGKIATEEFGKFEIWCTGNDALAEGYILTFKREQVDSRAQPNTKLGNLQNTTFLAYIIEKKGHRQERILLKNFGNKKTVKARRNPSRQELQLIWEFPEGDAPNELKLEGNIKGADFKQAIRQKIEHDFERCTLDELIKDQPDWDRQQQRWKIDLNKADFHTIKNFIKKRQNFHISEDSKYGKFTRAELSNVPVMPSSRAVAQQWLVRLLEYEAEKGFLLKAIFEQQANRFSRLEGLSMWSPQVPKVTDILEDQKFKSKKTETFWNLAAPVDLNPFTEVKQKGIAHFHLIPNNNYSFVDIAKRLLPKKKINAMILADRYVNSPEQQASFEALCAAVREEVGNIPVILATLNNKNPYHPRIPDVSVINFSRIGHQDHDRFIIFCTEVGEWIVWVASKSIDYLVFKSDFDHTTQGRTAGSVTFVKGTKKLLTPRLQQAIESKIQQKIQL